MLPVAWFCCSSMALNCWRVACCAWRFVSAQTKRSESLLRCSPSSVLPVERAADKTAGNAWIFLLLEAIEGKLRRINTKTDAVLNTMNDSIQRPDLAIVGWSNHSLGRTGVLLHGRGRSQKLT